MGAAMLMLLVVTACHRSAQVKTDSDTNAAGVASADTKKTKLERFAARHGVALVRGFTEIGSVPGAYGGAVHVGASELTNVSSGEKERGIWIRVKESGSLERENTSSIDYDEIDFLLAGIDYVSKTDASVTKLNNWQADYATRGDFRVSTFSSGDGSTMAAVVSGQIGGTQIFLARDDLARVRGMIAGAKNTLDVLGGSDGVKKTK